MPKKEPLLGPLKGFDPMYFYLAPPRCIPPYLPTAHHVCSPLWALRYIGRAEALRESLAGETRSREVEACDALSLSAPSELKNWTLHALAHMPLANFL